MTYTFILGDLTRGKPIKPDRKSTFNKTQVSTEVRHEFRREPDNAQRQNGESCATKFGACEMVHTISGLHRTIEKWAQTQRLIWQLREASNPKNVRQWELPRRTPAKY
jgi:hypothetical protein